MSSRIEFKNGLTEGFKNYKIAVDRASEQAKREIAVLALGWIINGSPNIDLTPPIKYGILRGSFSAFVGDVKILDTKSYNPKGTPNSSHSAPNNVITFGCNVIYAARVHEGLPPSPNAKMEPGTYTKQAGNAGGKFIEYHLQSDCKDYMKLYAEIIKRETGN